MHISTSPRDRRDLERWAHFGRALDRADGDSGRQNSAKRNSPRKAGRDKHRRRVVKCHDSPSPRALAQGKSSPKAAPRSPSLGHGFLAPRYPQDRPAPRRCWLPKYHLSTARRRALSPGRQTHQHASRLLSEQSRTRPVCGPAGRTPFPDGCERIARVKKCRPASRSARLSLRNAPHRAEDRDHDAKTEDIYKAGLEKSSDIEAGDGPWIGSRINRDPHQKQGLGGRRSIPTKVARLTCNPWSNRRPH